MNTRQRQHLREGAEAAERLKRRIDRRKYPIGICKGCGDEGEIVFQEEGLDAKCYMQQRRTGDTERQRVPKGQGARLSMRCSQADLDAWEAAAEAQDIDLREWVTARLNKAVGR